MHNSCSMWSWLEINSQIEKSLKGVFPFSLGKAKQKIACSFVTEVLIYISYNTACVTRDERCKQF